MKRALQTPRQGLGREYQTSARAAVFSLCWTAEPKRGSKHGCVRQSRRRVIDRGAPKPGCRSRFFNAAIGCVLVLLVACGGPSEDAMVSGNTNSDATPSPVTTAYNSLPETRDLPPVPFDGDYDNLVGVWQPIDDGESFEWLTVDLSKDRQGVLFVPWVDGCIVDGGGYLELLDGHLRIARAVDTAAVECSHREEPLAARISRCFQNGCEFTLDRDHLLLDPFDGMPIYLEKI